MGLNGNREGYFVALVSGDRNYTNAIKIKDKIQALRHKHADKLIVVAGEAEGADKLARIVCHALGIWFIGVPAPWRRFPMGKGNPAGPIRNEFMLNLLRPDVVLAFHPNLEKSKGTRDCVERAEKKGIKVKRYC